jgi:hypothetical protein
VNIHQRLQDTKTRTLAHYSLADDQLDLRYGPDKWSVRFILHHLADAETVLFDRIRRVLSERRQVVWAFDQDAWARGLDYATRPLALSRGIYDATRDGVIHDARVHYERSAAFEFVHSEMGLRTLQEEFDKVASHNEQHLKQIAAALAAFEPENG